VNEAILSYQTAHIVFPTHNKYFNYCNCFMLYNKDICRDHLCKHSTSYTEAACAANITLEQRIRGFACMRYINPRLID